jgi:chitobiase/beta-hexosaminidase-like protein
MRFIFSSPFVHGSVLIPVGRDYFMQTHLPDPSCAATPIQLFTPSSVQVVTVDDDNPSRLWHLGFRQDHLSDRKGESVMRIYLTLLTLILGASFVVAQDPGMEAAQLASQQATQMAAQAAQQANDQMMQAAQQANQAAMQNALQAAQNTPECYRCFAAKPKLSVKPGAYSKAVTVKLKDSTRGAVIYYTMDGWTPTVESTRYTGPITIDATTTLQAIAISPYGGRSRIATAVYTLNGVPPKAPVAQAVVAALNPAGEPSASAKLLLARGTAVPLVFASDVSSKTADVGDKISLAVAEDLKIGAVVVVKKGTPAVATVTEVDNTGMGGARRSVVSGGLAPSRQRSD